MIGNLAEKSIALFSFVQINLLSKELEDDRTIGKRRQK
jgi:hypothetical protein